MYKKVMPLIEDSKNENRKLVRVWTPGIHFNCHS